MNDYGIFGKLKIKNSLCCGWKNSFAFGDREIFSVLRVWSLFTVNMDHPVLTPLRIIYRHIYTHTHLFLEFILIFDILRLCQHFCWDWFSILSFCHTWLHPGFSARQEIQQLPACKMEPQIGRTPSTLINRQTQIR